MMEITPMSVLSAAVIALLLLVTSGVLYLTMSDWRDRRRLENERREARRR